MYKLTQNTKFDLHCSNQAKYVFRITDNDFIIIFKSNIENVRGCAILRSNHEIIGNIK